MSVTEKACTKCGETKALDGFHPNKQAKDGKKSWCKECVRADNNNRARKKRGEGREEELKALEDRREENLSLMKAGKRRCTKCREVNTLDRFPRQKGGFKSWCSQCSRSHQKAKYWEGREEELKDLENLRKENRGLMKGGKRRCAKCREIKLLEEYPGKKGATGSREPWCGECRRMSLALYQREYREKSSVKLRQYYQDTRDYKLAATKKRYRETAETTRSLSTKNHTLWAQEDDDFLMADNGMNVYQKAVTLGRTYRSSISRRSELRASINA